MGNDADVERVWETGPAKQEIAADHDREHVAQTLGAALAVDGALGEDRSQQPDNDKDAPATADDIFHERIQGRGNRGRGRTFDMSARPG